MKCKGTRKLCRAPTCPILLRLRTIRPIVKKFQHARSIHGPTPPSILVGEYGYPRIRLGPFISSETDGDASRFDAPEFWCEGGTPLDDIVRLRSSLFYSRFTSDVRAARGGGERLLELTQELTMATKPTDVEVDFKKRPRFRLTFDGMTKPFGIVGTVKDMRIAESPSVPRVIDRIVDDTDSRAETAIRELYDHGVSMYQIFRLLSAGLLGVSRHRRLVPTRWSITATDSMIANRLLEDVKNYEEIGEFMLHHHTYLGNHFEILLIPHSYAFEMEEIWMPRSIWSRGRKPTIHSVYEFYDGKASAMDGGYFAIRLPVVEHLNKMQRQAMVLAVREVHPAYYAPVGVWQVRENVRSALREKPLRFDDLKEAIADMSGRLETPSEEWVNRSKIMRFLRVQRSLMRWIEWKAGS